MLGFSNEEFKIMVDELLGGEQVSYDMLLYIAEKTLKPKVVSWCNADSRLRGREYEHDIMQEIYIRLLKTTIHSFLLKDGSNGPVNYDPEGFGKWMFTLAKRVKSNYAKRIQNGDDKSCELKENIVSEFGGIHELEITQERIARLKEAFSIVISADVSVYKVLTWVAQFIFILEEDITKIQSTALIVKSFEEETLSDMYRMLLQAGEEIPWLEFGKEQSERIEKALQKPWDDNSVYGQVKYKEFFMKKGAKETISDWTNRLNDKVRRTINNETFNH